MEYYRLPLDPAKAVTGRRLDRVDLRQAIHENIRLIIQSLVLSYRFDPHFGCIVDKFQAATPPQRRSERAWREEIREKIQKNLQSLLQRYETRVRIKDVLVDLRMPKNHQGKKPLAQVRIELTGQLTIGRREHFHFPDSELAAEAQEIFPLMIPVGR